jgi:hypothetical protein
MAALTRTLATTPTTTVTITIHLFYVLCPSSPGGGHSLTVLVSGDAAGQVHLTALGAFHLGCIDVGASLRSAGHRLLGDVCVRRVTLSPDLRSLVVVCGAGTTPASLVVYDTSSLATNAGTLTEVRRGAEPVGRAGTTLKGRLWSMCAIVLGMCGFVFGPFAVVPAVRPSVVVPQPRGAGPSNHAGPLECSDEGPV